MPTTGEITFNPEFEQFAKVPGVREIGVLAAEQGMYSASLPFVRQHGGPIVREILDTIPSSYYQEAQELGLYPSCDVRIHRLYPGMYPAIPGWHCDGEFRETYFGQPDLDRIPVSKHIICTVSSNEDGVSNTQFLTQPFTAYVPNVSNEVTLWSQVHEQVEALRPKTVLDTQDGEIMLFSARTLHRAMPCKVRGWRLFFRMSMWHKPNLGEGQLARQEQVYVVSERNGW